jgi:predicted dehydrogenase
VIGVGLIGYGLGGSVFHAPLVQAEPRLRLAAVATSRGDQVRRDHPGVRVVATAGELLADPSVELVVVAAPNAVHHELAAAALRAGRHAVVDKPFTLTTAEADQLIALAAATDRRLSVFHNRRWDGDFLTVRRLLEAGTLGEVTGFVSRYDRFRPAPRGSWKEAAVPGSGILWDLGPHLVDQALALFGPPGTVWADVGMQRAGVHAVDYAHLALGYGRLRVLLHAAMVVRDPGPRFEVHGGTPHQEETVLDVAASLQATYPLVRLPTAERPERALFISLAAVALQAVHDAEMKLGDAVSVHGLGTIGLLTVQMCRLEGIQNVFAIDPDPERRKLAAGLGATVVAAGFYQGGAANVRLGEEFHHNRLSLIASIGAWGAPTARPPSGTGAGSWTPPPGCSTPTGSRSTGCSPAESTVGPSGCA